MENGNGRRIVYGPVLFMTRQCGKLMQLSYDTIAFPGFYSGMEILRTFQGRNSGNRCKK